MSAPAPSAAESHRLRLLLYVATTRAVRAREGRPLATDAEDLALVARAGGIPGTLRAAAASALREALPDGIPEEGWP